MRVKSDKPVTLSSGEVGYIHKLTDAIMPAQWVDRPEEKRLTDSELHARFSESCYEWRCGPGRIGELAGLLKVSPVALAWLGVGWDGQAWTMPERNHLGQIIGVNRRFEDGKKVCVIGSRRGLTYATHWYTALGPIFVVEGASDVAAGLTLGLCVVGRPSNTGGGKYLGSLLKPHNRRMVVLAERDAKDRETLPECHDPECHCCCRCFPGKFGAVETANKLKMALWRLIDWSFCPDGAKDLRAWLNSRGANPMNEIALERIAASLKRRTRNVIHS